VVRCGGAGEGVRRERGGAAGEGGGGWWRGGDLTSWMADLLR